MSIAITITAMTRIPSRIIPSPVIMSVALCAFRLDLRLYRRYEELPQWEVFVHKHCPDRPIPTTKKDRARLHKEVDSLLLEARTFSNGTSSFVPRSIWVLSSSKLPYGTKCRLASCCSTAGISPMNWCPSPATTKRLDELAQEEPQSGAPQLFVLKDAAGNLIRLEGPHIAVEALVPLIPPTAYRAVTVKDKTYWTFTWLCVCPAWAKSGWW